MPNDSRRVGRKKWRLPMGQLHALRTHAHEMALLTEPTRQFPGVDIDAIHYKRKPLKRAA